MTNKTLFCPACGEPLRLTVVQEVEVDTWEVSGNTFIYLDEVVTDEKVTQVDCEYCDDFELSDENGLTPQQIEAAIEGVRDDLEYDRTHPLNEFD